MYFLPELFSDICEVDIRSFRPSTKSLVDGSCATLPGLKEPPIPPFPPLLFPGVEHPMEDDVGVLAPIECAGRGIVELAEPGGGTRP